MLEKTIRIRARPTDLFNLYSILRDKYGKEKEEVTFPIPTGGVVSIRTFDKDILLSRAVKWSEKEKLFVMDDEAILPKDIGDEILKSLPAKCKTLKEEDTIRVECEGRKKEALKSII